MKKILLLSVFSCLAGLVVGQVSQTLDSVEFLLKSEKTHQADILLKRLEKIPNPTLNTRSKARILVNQARVNNANGNYTASLEFLIKAEHLLKKKHLEASLPLLYTTFGDLFYNLGAYDLSIEHYHTFLQYEHDETKRFYVFNRIGTIYYKQERYDEARKIFEEQYEISKHFSTELEQLSAYNNIALANMRKGNYEIAIGQFLKVINGLEKYGTRHKDFYTVVCNNVGYAYYWMRRYENAIPYFEKAKENNPNIPPDLLNLQKFLGECYLNTGQIKKAEKLESEIRKNYASMSTSAQINFNSFRHKLYTALGQSEKLSKLNLESEVLYETLMSEHKKRDNTTASIVTKYLIYASEEKLKEEKIAKENTARALVLKKREFNLVISILIIASLSIIIAIFLFRQRLKNKQSKAQIEKELLLLKEEKLKQQIEMQSRSLTDFAIEIKQIGRAHV